MALNPIVAGNTGAQAAATILDNDQQAVIRWAAGTYNAGRTVIDAGLMYTAAINIVTPTNQPSTGSRTQWPETLTGLAKSEKIGFLQGDPANIILNKDAQTLQFVGAANLVAGQKLRYLITAQTLDLTLVVGNTTVLTVDKATGAVKRYVSSNVAGIPDTEIIFGGITKSATKWYLTNVSNYTYLPADAAVFNNFFESPSDPAQSQPVGSAIISMQWYDVADTEYIVFYGLGKQYTFATTPSLILRDYLGFRLGGPSLNAALNPVEWSGSATQDNQTAPAGIKTYTFNRANGALIGKVVIDWDRIPTGYRLVQTTSASANTKVLRYTFLKTTVSNTIKRTNAVIPDVDLDKYYDTAVTASYANGGSSVPLGLANVNSFYAMWDALQVVATSAYCTRSLITNAAGAVGGTPGTLNIFAYTFTPPLSDLSDPSEANPVYRPTVLLILNTHGYEKTGALCIYELMNQVVTNWTSDPFLTYLRWNANIVVIPSANPSGWNALSGQGTRQNANGVDLNRNWPVGWFLNPDPTSSTYGGPSALSEIESQTIKAFVDTLPNGFIGLDFHNFAAAPDADPKNYYTAWFEASTKFMCDIGYAMARATTRNFRPKTPYLPADVNWLAARTNVGSPAGKTAAYLDSINWYAGTFEVCQGFRFNPGFQYHDADAIRFGVESQGNLIRLIIRNASIDFNEKF